MRADQPLCSDWSGVAFVQVKCGFCTGWLCGCAEGCPRVQISFVIMPRRAPVKPCSIRGFLAYKEYILNPS